ncbi:MAG TPA: hypothetical protein VHK91_08920 [Flavisolibacter sp.]|jgi:hypothetical protein|nr:hypothetical protein [Flavisolibacter sp.]
MKQALLTIVLFFSFARCQTKDSTSLPEKKLRASYSIPDSLAAAYVAELDAPYVDEEQVADSMLREMFHIATARASGKKYSKELSGSYYREKVAGWASMDYGYLFEPTTQHLIARRTLHGVLSYLDVFRKEGGRFIRQIRVSLDDRSYVSDSVFDANGDGFKDFLICTYSSAGCCRRNVYQVFLSQRSGTEFSTGYTFMNPTFYPREKLIRGIYYGHQGQVPIYTFAWKGPRIDTLEFIYPDTSHSHSYYKIMKGIGGRQYLKELPKEYLTLKDLDWFMGEQ